MADTYAVKFSEVAVPQNIESVLANERTQNINKAILSSVSREEAEKAYPQEKWDQTHMCIEAIKGAINTFFNLTYLDEKRQATVVPMEQRRLAAGIEYKLSGFPDEVVLNKGEMEFLIKVLTSPLPPATLFVFILNYLEDVKLAVDKKV